MKPASRSACVMCAPLSSALIGDGDRKSPAIVTKCAAYSGCAATRSRISVRKRARLSTLSGVMQETNVNNAMRSGRHAPVHVVDCENCDFAGRRRHRLSGDCDGACECESPNGKEREIVSHLAFVRAEQAEQGAGERDDR